MSHKSADISAWTLNNCRAAFRYLDIFFKDKPAIYIGTGANNFAEWLNNQGLAGVSVKTYYEWQDINRGVAAVD